MSIIDHLKWRYATKNFDASKKVSKEDLERIKEAVQFSASSYGLQLYKVLIVEDKAVREKLKSASWNQAQITDASHLLVFCNYADVSDEHIDEYLTLKSEIQKIEKSGLKGYGDFMKGAIGAKSLEEKRTWTSKQTYIALSNVLTACAELQIDACPMEGFDPMEYNGILGLEEKGLNASVIVTIGYRSEEDQTQHITKVRKPKHLLFEEV